ncbi:EF-P beta-lysylation protein EpmB [Neptunomonas sp.]|uniref:EF-P beta-lysylation protein EpmB n=1 Tax=Neptunomonas sp. TaxID=1971898 RepID=UPI0025CECF56|nr:EF-P beta-lysylation protein EpmB [Neptunomonas sp.]
MNHITPFFVETDWQTLLRQSICNIDELLNEVKLDSSILPVSAQAATDFAIRVPTPYLNRIEKGNPNDPLLLQVLPQPAEMERYPGYSNDPLEELDTNPAPGLIHKYKGRVLLILSGACAINCRYCFRRHFPYQENQLGSQQWQQVLQYLKNDQSITEVIFSGGDPLATPDKRLNNMIRDIEAIAHIQRLRIHSRLPVVIPQRVTDELCHTLASSRLQTVCVLHVNHANEVDTQVAKSIAKLQAAKVTVLNQSVLLKGINDSVDCLKNLSEKLFTYGVLPYYLFVLDPVHGAAHFDVSDNDAIALVNTLQTELPGYLVPRLAREIPGRPSKTLLSLT